jgi:hypothetical protein
MIETARIHFEQPRNESKYNGCIIGRLRCTSGIGPTNASTRRSTIRTELEDRLTQQGRLLKTAIDDNVKFWTMKKKYTNEQIFLLELSPCISSSRNAKVNWRLLTRLQSLRPWQRYLGWHACFAYVFFILGIFATSIAKRKYINAVLAVFFFSRKNEACISTKVPTNFSDPWSNYSFQIGMMSKDML